MLLRTKVALGIAILGIVLSGCRVVGIGGKREPHDEAVLLTVDFEPGQTLRYKFVAHREILLNWDPNAAASARSVQKQTERMEMVVSYAPVAVDPCGISTIRAQCESVAIERTGRPSGRGANTDAVTAAQDKTFVFKVDARGKMVEASELEQLIQDLGAGAFRGDAGSKRVKEPDMIGDFIASQWFLWDAISSVARPASGVAVGQSWRSKLSVPTPMVMRKARDVTYRLEEVRATDEAVMAVIASTYELAETTPSDWPIPYAGRFQMSGTFGFLGAYDIAFLRGTGRDLFNVGAGRIERSEHRYTMEMKASVPPMGIRANPQITIEQTLTMERLSP